MRTVAAQRRNGITLMEVLISIGILAIGLSSVVALVPAGKSQAAKAVVFDRAANLAMNVLNDAVTFGLTRPASFTARQVAAPLGFPTMVIFDPLHLRNGLAVESGTLGWSNAFAGLAKRKGVFASGTDGAASAPGVPEYALPFAILQSRDDLSYAPPTTEDAPPMNAFSGGVRSFQGRTSAILAIAPANGAAGQLAPGDLARVTAVVFHNRSLADLADAVVTGTYFGPQAPDGPADPPPGTLRLVAPEGRMLKDVVRAGTAVYFRGDSSTSPPTAPAWYQVAMASADEENGWVYVTFVGDTEPPTAASGGQTPVSIALDSIGMADRIVILEGAGSYGR